MITPVGAAAKQVYNPAVTGTPSAVLFNSGPGVVYVGGAGVTPNNGLPVQPHNGIDFAYAPTALFAVAGGLTLSGSVTTTTSAAITHGASTTVGVAAVTGFVAGQTVQVGAGTAAETLVVKATSTAPSITFTTKPAYDHISGVAVTLVTNAVTGTLRVTAGVP